VIELLAALLDAVVQALPGIKNARDRQRLANIGAELLNFYNDTNRMLVAGDNLVQLLRTYEKFGTKDPEKFPYMGRVLQTDVVEQARTLKAIRNSYVNLENHLGPLIDNDSFRRLHVLFVIKLSALDLLATLLLDGKLPLDTGSGLETLIESGGHQDMIRYVYSLETIPLNEDTTSRHLAIVRAYLRARQPESELEHIAEGLEEIRKAIIANFNLEDVLLKVREQRWSPKSIPAL
jgi:hypothetical protein